ncbi:MAG: DegT/DnrJ/EryC1/StrS family aminotransferase [Alphaproteobacteria bacterium]|nr:DegT/DnrJ/EryC1/StrS family aminotransferase [Alphaproteobacteria bacterium]
MPDQNIPQTDPKAGYLAHKGEIDRAIQRCLDSGWYILGQEVAAFEREFAAYIGARHGIGVANGTDALVLGLRALGVGAGDLVATVSHTAVATVAAIELAGATPLLIDIDPDRFTIDPADLDAALRRHAGQVKAIIPVHLYGQPADMPAIVALARQHGARIMEDCSQAHGAALDGRKLGLWGDLAAYSLYPTKNLGALGDGGVLTTDDDGLNQRLRMLREYGWRERYISDSAGANSRLDELQAAILRVKLAHLEAENARRHQIAEAYDRALDNGPIKAPGRVAKASHVFHQYVVKTPNRDRFRARLKERGIATALHYPMAVHQQPAYRGRIALAPAAMKNTEAVLPHIVSLPMFGQMADGQVERVAAALKDYARAN